jgi:hypothetical protein
VLHPFVVVEIAGSSTGAKDRAGYLQGKCVITGARALPVFAVAQIPDPAIRLHCEVTGKTLLLHPELTEPRQ